MTQPFARQHNPTQIDNPENAYIILVETTRTPTW